MAAEQSAPKVGKVRRRGNELHIRYSDGSRDVIRQAVKGRYQSTKAFRVDSDGTVSAEDVNR
ncbi:hypothetical protein ABZ949_01995 [Micromonospora tulbaghiae]|uniref:hypothetical protein n=1 Tax=Micromonospora tulbaghiae TaxID=479978 RepID=UPI0033F84569